MKSRKFTTMPFGKHKGLPFREIPTSYLEWLTENMGLREPLKTSVADELKFREILDAEGATAVATSQASVVDKVRREMALKYHPDRRGGSTKEMAAVNATCDEIAARLGEDIP